MKLALYYDTEGIGVQGNLMEFIGSVSSADYVWGYGTSGSLTNVMYLDSGTKTLQIDNINEITTDNGVVIDGVRMKDGIIGSNLSAIGIGVATTSYNNIAIGDGATCSGYNGAVAVGRNANSQKYSVSIGYSSYSFDYGTSVGYNSSATTYGVAVGNAKSDSYDISIGYNCGSSDTAGNNICIGTDAGDAMDSSALQNLCIGKNSGTDITSGYSNTCCGYRTAENMTTGNYNTAVGYAAMSFGAVTGYGNVAVGGRYISGSTYETALENLTSGNCNVGIGCGAGQTITTGSYNVCIGDSSDCAATGSNQIAIGYGAVTTVSNTIRMGNSSISNAYMETAWIEVSDRRYKQLIDDYIGGLNFINKLNPVQYCLIDDPNQKQRFGLIAQDIPDRRFVDYDAEIDKYGISYENFIMPLINSVKELTSINTQQIQQNKELDDINTKQNQEIEYLKDENCILRYEIQMIKQHLGI